MNTIPNYIACIFYNGVIIMDGCGGCNTNTTNRNNCCNNTSGGYAFILVLFILIVLVGAAWLN